MAHEIDKQRPAVVVSSDAINKAAAALVVIVPISDAEGKLGFDGQPRFKTQVLVNTSDKNGLHKQSVAVCDQLRSVDNSRLLNRLGVLTAKEMNDISDALCLVMDLFG